MVRPRWHDVVISIAIIAVIATGCAVFWGGDLLRALGISNSSGSAASNPAASPNDSVPSGVGGGT